jgi:hypothetical protein
MKKYRVSHSARQLHETCSYRWKLHYVDKLRSVFLDSPLFLGKALDEAFSRLLLEKKKELTEAETNLMDKTAEFIFDDHFTHTDYNDQWIYIPDHEFCRYSKSDYDATLLRQEDIDRWEDHTGFDQHVAFYNDCLAKIARKEEMPTDYTRAYNMLVWLSLRRKGHLLLEAYKNTILPQIKEVFSLQEQITLPNETGDSISGLIDFTCEFVDDPGVTYIVDNKTASKAYKFSDLKESDQLATYCEYKNNYNAAYVVIEKTIYKKHPKIHTQILKGNIEPEQVEKTFDKFENMINNIHEEVFEKNFDSKCFFFGRACAYFSHCRNGSMKNLVVKKETT